MKNISSKLKNKIDKAYSELPYKSFEDINNMINKKAEIYFAKYPEKTTDFLKLVSPQDRISIICLGFYLSIENDDFEHLNNALYTYNLIEYLANKNKDLRVYAGTDSYFVIPLLRCLAGNDLKHGNYYLEKYGGYSKTGHRFTIILSNLIYSYIKRDDDLILKAIVDAEGFIKKKNSIYSQNVIEFLLAVYKEDYGKICSSFSAAVNNYQREKSIHQFYNDLYKYVPIQFFGILKAAHLYLGDDFYNNFKEPDNEIWRQDYYNVLKKGKAGANVLNFSGELSFIKDEL